MLACHARPRAFRAAIPGAKPTLNALPHDAGRWPELTTLTLSDAFGSKISFEDAILAFVRTHPGVVTWCETERRTISDEDRLARRFSKETGTVRLRL